MSFAESFWTPDYELGFQQLFLQLNQGILENNDFVRLIERRMELEVVYGNSLETITTDCKPLNKRQLNEDFVSTIKNAYTKMNETFYKQGEYHLNIADNIETIVLQPFSKWCTEHEQRVKFSESTLQDKLKALKNAQYLVEKLQKKYFNKCRMLEEFKSHYTEEELQEELSNLSFQKDRAAKTNTDGSKEEDDNDTADEEIYEFTHAKYDTKQMKALLKAMLTEVPMGPHKVAILGTYQNV